MSKEINRLDIILECIENIDFIINDSNLKITQAIDDKILKPVIRINIIIINFKYFTI